MPRATDPSWEHVEVLPNNKWKCNFCGNEYAGGVTRIKAHLAGLSGYGIHGCKDVDGQVRSEALKVLKGKTSVEGNVEGSSNLTQGPHQPVTAGNEGAWRETSFAAMPYLSSDVISTVGAGSSDFLPFPETNLLHQSLPAQNMIPQWDTLFWPQSSQTHAGEFNIQPWNLSHPSSSRDLAPEALTNMSHPLNAEEGEPDTEVPQDSRTDDALVDSQPGTCGLVDENLQSLKSKLEELSSREADMDELETWCRKAKRIKGEYWSMVQAFREGRSLSQQQVERMDDLRKEVEGILGHGSFQKGLTTHAAECWKSSPLVTTKLVGHESENIIRKICEYLMEDEIFIIGVYGMGGVGKTAILMHIHNRILLENPAFNDVFWVTVPQEFSMYELQDEIANAVGLRNISKDKDVKRRACLLDRHLKKKKRSILILDDLWMHFEVKDVGIPLEKGDLKLVLTTRSLDVCSKMLCQKKIKIELLRRPLDNWSFFLAPENWSLFLEKLCFGRKLPSEVEEIARSIVDKCEGLPLGIIEIATRMRGVEKVHEWKGMLRKLEDSRMELDVFKRLKLSYMNLGDPQVQQCFLHFVLCFGIDPSKTNVKDLIESFIDEGLLGGIATRQEMHNQGNTILDKLRKASLLDDPDEHAPPMIRDRTLQHVHPMIRDMTLQLVTSTTHMVKACMGLKEIPEEESWTDHLEKVFLQGNCIKEIRYGISPKCPKLTRLSLNDNDMLRVIHESFFRHLNGLKVLDLSNTGITEIPDPILHLERLEALLLRRCSALCRIPWVGKLGSLRKLDLNGCAGLEAVPEGMEMLVKLRYLDLDGTQIKTLPEGVLGKLVNLQYLVIQEVRAGEETNLNKVEALYFCVPDVETFNAYARLLEQNSSQEYRLVLNVSMEDFVRSYNERHIIIGSCNGISARVDGDSCALLPKNVQVLEVRRCGGVTSLCNIGPLENLEELVIEEWEMLEELGAVHFPRLWNLNITGCSKLRHLLGLEQWLPCLLRFEIKGLEELEGINIVAPKLQQIFVYECPKMTRVLEGQWLTTRLQDLLRIYVFNCAKLEEIIAGPLPRSATSLLRGLSIEGCNSMKRELLTSDVLPCLPFLESICVESCESIEVIIGNGAIIPHSSFPKLIRLTLMNLPELRSVCDGAMRFNSVCWIDVKGCPRLKSISLQLPLLDNGLPSPPPSLQEIKIDNWQSWESLEWDHPLAPSSLEHCLRFYT